MTEEMEEKPAETKSIRRRRRVSFRLPKRAALTVRALWASAEEEERMKAHRTGVAILELWLGQASRKEIADRLQVPPLRIWQLSQQALSGLVAGLLKQPKSRSQIQKNPLEESRWKLKSKIAKLEGEVESLRTLVSLLRELPAHRARSPDKREVELVRPGRESSKTVKRTEAGLGRKTPKRRSRKRRARTPGSTLRGEGADRAKLDEKLGGAPQEGGAPPAQ